MLRKKQNAFIEKMKTEHRCYKLFINSLNRPVSKQGYSYKLQGFMKYCTIRSITKSEEDYEALLLLDVEEVTDLLIDYVEYLEEKKISAVTNYLVAPELFFEMNRKLWHKKVVTKSITKDDRRIVAGKTPASDDDVFNMINANPLTRNKLIIHYAASTGSRPGSIIDPPLKFKHLIPLPDIGGLGKFDFDPENDPELDIYKYASERYCYAIKIYDGSNEGYWAFLIPDASDIMDEYRDERTLNGEKITNESYIFVTFVDSHQVKYEFVTNDNLNHIIQKSIKDAKVQRHHVYKNLFNKSQNYMFRKRFNGHLKLENDVNSNIAEKLMAHKRGLDGVYLQPTLGECYVEFYKAIPRLTPNPKQRHKLEIEQKDKIISTQEKKLNVEIANLKFQVKELSEEKVNSTKQKPDPAQVIKLLKLIEENNIQL